MLYNLRDWVTIVSLIFNSVPTRDDLKDSRKNLN